MNYKDMPLVASPLSDVDRAVLIRLVGHLVDFLRAPGDWGYQSKLGFLTERLIEVRLELRGLVIPEANLASTLTSDEPCAECISPPTCAAYGCAERADMLKDHPTRRTP